MCNRNNSSSSQNTYYNFILLLPTFPLLGAILVKKSQQPEAILSPVVQWGKSSIKPLPGYPGGHLGRGGKIATSGLYKSKKQQEQQQNIWSGVLTAVVSSTQVLLLFGTAAKRKKLYICTPVWENFES